MGHSIFSVSIVEFVRGKLRVLSETSDRVGGRDMDECLMREFAAQFQKKVRIQRGNFNQQQSQKESEFNENVRDFRALRGLFKKWQ